LLFAYAVAPRSGISIPASECTVSAAYGKVQSTLVSAVEAGEAIMPGRAPIWRRRCKPTAQLVDPRIVKQQTTFLVELTMSVRRANGAKHDCRPRQSA
jgi:hypothetical protein